MQVTPKQATTACAQDNNGTIHPWEAAAGLLKQGLLWLQTQQDPPHILPAPIGDHHVLPHGMDTVIRFPSFHEIGAATRTRYAAFQPMLTRDKLREIERVSLG